MALARRNFIEVWRDPLSLSLTIGLPLGMLLVLGLLEDVDSFFATASLVPGVVLFGFVMLMFSAALALSKDREIALFDRLLTAPLRPSDFVAGYSIPYIPVAIMQAAVLFGVGFALGLEVNGNILIVGLILLLMSILYVAWGMILGMTFSTKTVSFPYMAILLLTIFGGAWMDLEAIGGVFRTAGNALPFAHALDAARAVLIDGDGFGAVSSDVLWVLAYTVASGALAVYVFRQRVQPVRRFGPERFEPDPPEAAATSGRTIIRGSDTAGSTTGRLHSIDHLRAALVALVVVHHVALVYGAGAPFYYVEPPTGDESTFRTLLIFVLANQAWFMGAFFLLAGYFTPTAFDRKGPATFLSDRLVRLGIPLAVFVFVLNPVSELGFFLMPTELTGITRDPTWSDYPNLIGLGPLWFVAMLLIFSIGYAGWRQVRNSTGRAPGLPGMYSIVLFTGLLGLGGYLMRLIVPLGEDVWQFPTLAYLPQYASFFIIGVIAGRGDWLRAVTGPMGIVGALAAAVASVVLFPLAFSGSWFSLELTAALDNAMGEGHWQSAAYAAWDAIVSVGLVIALIALFRAVAGRRSRLGTILAEHSYAVYVLHIPVVVFLAYFARSIDLGPMAKFGVMSVAALVATLAVAVAVRLLPGARRVL